jgi:hypothetical protein
MFGAPGVIEFFSWPFRDACSFLGKMDGAFARRNLPRSFPAENPRTLLL